MKYMISFVHKKKDKHSPLFSYCINQYKLPFSQENVTHRSNVIFLWNKSRRSTVLPCHQREDE